jgi:aquaglyceroporin related protein
LTNRTNNTNNTGGLHNAHERAEKKQEQTVDIENEYFALNPWYNQQKKKPVFGLAAPLPRTVRRGMWWGRGDLRKSMYKVDEEQEDDGIERHDALDFSGQPGELPLCSSRQMDTVANKCSTRYRRRF